MSDEYQFERAPGQPAIRQSETGGYEMLMGAPDWVMLPIELGGGKVYVAAIGTRACALPDCDEEGVRVLYLENGLGVTECTTCKRFGWFKIPED